MIGHLQRNKAKLAVQLFDVIESLDNMALARELDKEATKSRQESSRLRRSQCRAARKVRAGSPKAPLRP